MSTDSFDLEAADNVNYIMNLMAQSGDLFDIVRVVDPVAQKVNEHRNVEGTKYPNQCYGFWSEQSTCRDCISAKAFHGNRMMIKMEYHQNRVYMISAVPLQMEGRCVVVELIKNISESMPAVSGEPDEMRALFDQADQFSIHDEPTGLYNRLFIDGQIPREISRARATRYPLSMLLVAIDDFPRLVSRYGAPMGDAVLRSMGEMLKNSMRKESDWVARYDGESFLVVMRNTPPEGAHTVAERLHARIGRAEFLFEEKKVPITASLAVYTDVPGPGPYDMASPLPPLANRVYAAGIAGGNRVV